MPLIRKPDAGTPPTPAPADLHGVLRRGSADERWCAARRLGAVAGNVAILADALAEESDLRVREAIFTALAHDGSEPAVSALLSRLRSSDAALRTGAMDALGTIPGAIAQAIEPLLKDRDPDVRILSCDLTRRLPAADASRQLAALLDRESETNVCGAAIEALSEVGDQNALPSLRACAARFSGDSFIGFAAELAIRRIGESASGSPVSTS